MALGLSIAPFTLVLMDQGAELWDPDGRRLVSLEPGLPSEAPSRQAWIDTLRRHLGRRAPVQLVLASDRTEVLCQEVPYLSPREQRGVADRLVAASQPAEALVLSQTVDRDPQAEGAHQLWVCAHAERELRIWLEVLAAAGAVPVLALPWERAFLAAQEGEARSALQVIVEPGQGRIVVFKGRGLLLSRTFALPEDLDLGRMDAGDAELLAEVLGEEATRVLQFVKQKHRGLVFQDVGLVGLPELPEALVERLGRGLRLTVSLLEPSTAQRILRGCAQERHRKGGLNLLPTDVVEARKLRMLRLTVWAAASLLLAGSAAAYLLLRREEAELQKGLALAQQAREQRRALKVEAERAGQLRLGLLRLRMAEHRQVEALERLERLGLTVFRTPEGITLEKVEISAVPGEAVRFRFQVEGAARTRGAFSVGPLGRYLEQLAGHPGVQLEPLQEVVVSDRVPASGGSLERAVTRFRLAGVAP